MIVTVLFPVSAVTCFRFVVRFAVSTYLLLCTSFHNSWHRLPTRLTALAQKLHLTVLPQQHRAHHRDQTIRYCVINGTLLATQK